MDYIAAGYAGFSAIIFFFSTASLHMIVNSPGSESVDGCSRVRNMTLNFPVSLLALLAMAYVAYGFASDVSND